MKKTENVNLLILGSRTDPGYIITLNKTAEKNATKNILDGTKDRQRLNSIPPPPSGSGGIII